MGITIICYGVSFLFPVYRWGVSVPSPDGKYDLVVLSSGILITQDPLYHIYLFPHSLVPKDKTKNSHVWFTQIWRGKKYLIYSGNDVPYIRWSGPRAIEIIFDGEGPSMTSPVKNFEDPPIAVSMIYGVNVLAYTNNGSVISLSNYNGTNIIVNNNYYYPPW